MIFFEAIARSKAPRDAQIIVVVKQYGFFREHSAELNAFGFLFVEFISSDETSGATWRFAHGEGLLLAETFVL